MIIDGRAIAEKVKEDLKRGIQSLGFSPKLIAIQLGDDLASESFLKIKKKVGEDIGVTVEVMKLPQSMSEDEVIAVIKEKNENETVYGIIVQLPLPKNFNTTKVLDAIAPEKDPDALSTKPKVLAPVVLAVREILENSNISLEDKKVVVLGHGDLVGKPVAEWLKQVGISPFMIDETNAQVNSSVEALAKADIVISGVGKPGIITSEKIKEGVVIIDAGTSESGGKLAGDLSPGAYDKCSFYTPVPGGVGPVVTAMLFKNLMILATSSRNR
ncbi:MAG TPA: bifunctional 5,10-methylenetetrahydrofolate dehydrogenase/5,10-methenyltetrahydrofolate cyclohydrolase [Candidatus Paceibacterota bacterium]